MNVAAHAASFGQEEKISLRVDLGILRANYRALTHYVRAISAAPTAPCIAEADGACPRATTCPPPQPGAFSRHTGRPICVVKADAYGHGAAACAAALCKEGADFFAVSSLAEALSVRVAAPTAAVLVLSPVFPGEAVSYVRFRLTATLADADGARAVSTAVAAAIAAGRLPPEAALSCHLKLDSGMGRMGFRLTGGELDATLTALRGLCTLPHLRAVGVYSHLACADDENSPATAAQADLFFRAVSRLHGWGLCPITHLANSAAALRLGDMGCTHYRLGLSLYGIPPAGRFPAPLREKMRAPLTLTARILRLSRLAVGEAVGYGATWRAGRQTPTATVGIGYADGLLRACTGGHLLYGGHPLPLIGRISMDQCTVATGAAPCRVGEHVTVFDESGENLMALARQAGTVPYELLALTGRRADRQYL